MDNIGLKKIALLCGSTKHTFGGVWSCDNFPKINKRSGKKQKLAKQCRVTKFQIINSAPSNTSGQHWLLLIAINIHETERVFVWDCLGRPISFYDHFHERLIKLYGRATGAFTTVKLTLQNVSSNLCGLYCLYLVHYLVRYPFIALKLHKINTLLQTTEIDVVRFFNQKITGAIFKYSII